MNDRGRRLPRSRVGQGRLLVLDRLGIRKADVWKETCSDQGHCRHGHADDDHEPLSLVVRPSDGDSLGSTGQIFDNEACRVLVRRVRQS